MAAAAGPVDGVRGAWAVLLTQPDYLVGVRALHASLRAAGTRYPLVVMVTAAVGDDARAVLAADGALVREVAPLRPSGRGAHYAKAVFAEVWTKLAVWRLVEFDRVVCVDADMLVLRGMDELFEVPLAPGQLAACHACRCNPRRIPTYPADWVPENCAYTHLERGQDAAGAGEAPGYLNGGLLVLQPDAAEHDRLLDALSSVEDLSRYPFAEQDFLNEQHAGRWVALPWVYNALKTLPLQHPTLWDPAAAKNVHYINDKPWDRPPGSTAPGDPFADLERLWWATAAVLEPDTARA